MTRYHSRDPGTSRADELIGGVALGGCPPAVGLDVPYPESIGDPIYHTYRDDQRPVGTTDWNCGSRVAVGVVQRPYFDRRSQLGYAMGQG